MNAVDACFLLLGILVFAVGVLTTWDATWDAHNDR